jgi:hypothetical protein
MRALGTVIAERTLSRVDDKGKRKTVSIRIGQPMPYGKDYVVPWQVTGLEERSKIRRMYGADSMQALVLTLETVHLHLAQFKNIQWLGLDDLALLPRDLTTLVPEEEAERLMGLMRQAKESLPPESKK